MKQPAAPTNPFLVIRATVEAEIAAPGILAISSALSGDGKTAVAAGIAQSLAAGGYRTLVVDAGTRTGAGGAPFTAEDAGDRVARAVRPTATGSDYLALADLGADVSSAVAIGVLYAAIRARYAYAVVDSSVLNGDGLALARGADGVVLAVREGRAIDVADGEAVQLLNRLHARFLGVVATTERATDEHDGRATLLERLQRRFPARSVIVPEPAPAGGVVNVAQRIWQRVVIGAAAVAARTREIVPARPSTPK